MTVQEDIERFRNIQKLKFVYRLMDKTIDGEKESTADHSWCCLVVSDYLLSKLDAICPWKYHLDKLKIYELITYHDLLEAETGDISLNPVKSEEHKNKAEAEEKIFPIFLQKLPEEIQWLYRARHLEYEARESLESTFVKLVDTVEAYYQYCVHKDIFENWTETYFVQKAEKHFKPFPELLFIYEELLVYFRENGYFTAE